MRDNRWKNNKYKEKRQELVNINIVDKNEERVRKAMERKIANIMKKYEK